MQTALSGAGVAAGETNLGDLIADAVRQTGQAQVGLVARRRDQHKGADPAGRTDPEPSLPPCAMPTTPATPSWS